MYLYSYIYGQMFIYWVPTSNIGMTNNKLAKAVSL